MFRSRLLYSSIALNLLLLGFGVWSMARKTVDLPPATPPTAEMPQVTSQAISAPFRWGQLEAADYPAYIGNLRAIGCPEETIRDIITADVASQYAEKRAQFRQAAAPAPGQRPPTLTQPSDAQPIELRAPGQPRGVNAATQSFTNQSAAEPAGLSLQALENEQVSLLATLLRSLASNLTAPTPANVPESPTPTPAPAPKPRSKSATPAPLETQPAEAESRLLTHEQEVLRAKVGWQAFYYTTAEDNAQQRASSPAR